MPKGPRGQERLADVIGNAAFLGADQRLDDSGAGRQPVSAN